MSYYKLLDESGNIIDVRSGESPPSPEYTSASEEEGNAFVHNNMVSEYIIGHSPSNDI